MASLKRGIERVSSGARALQPKPSGWVLGEICVSNGVPIHGRVGEPGNVDGTEDGFGGYAIEGVGQCDLLAVLGDSSQGVDWRDELIQGTQCFVDGQRLYNIAPMETVLVIDTATDVCGVACRYRGRVFQDTRSVHRSHNTLLLGMLDELCRRAGFLPRSIDAVGFVAGPGSFTGIRIAAAVSQALARASGAKLHALGSADLLAMAAQRQREQTSQPARLMTVLPSRRDRYYCAQFSAGQERLMEVPNRLLDGDQLVAEVRAACGAEPLYVALGHGVDQDGLAGLHGLVGAAGDELVCQPVPVGSELLLEHACQRHAASAEAATVDAAGEQRLAGLPIYVEGDTPWQPKAEPKPKQAGP